MAIRKKAFKKDLANLYDYLTRDDQPFSDDYFNVVQFPEQLTAGKNLFKIRTNNVIFVDRSLIHVEVLDFNGNPIYVEPLQYIEKDGTRVISIYIYPDTSPGLATVYLAGRLARYNGEPVPFSRDFNSPDHADIPNMIWSRRVPVAPTQPNDTEIIFVEQPSLTISEVIQPYLQPVNVFNVFTRQTSSNAGATLEIVPVPSTISSEQQTAAQAPAGGNTAATPTFATQFFDFSANQTTLDGTGGSEMVNPPINSLYGSSKLITTNFPLRSDMEGGILEVHDSQITVPGRTAMNLSSRVLPSTQIATEYGIDTGNAQSSQQLSGSLKFAITSVVNNTTAFVAQYAGFKNEADNTFGPFKIRTGQNASPTGLTLPGGGQTYAPTSETDISIIDSASDFTASFIAPTAVVFTENSSSYADIIIANTEPETGDVYRIKTLYKPSGFFGDFIDLGDTILERQNILIDTGSLETNITIGAAYERFGNFESLQEIQEYWVTSSIGPGLNYTNVSFNEDILIGGADLKMEWAGGSTYEAPIDAAGVFSIDPKYQVRLYRNTTYIVNFQVALPNDIESYTSLDSNLTNERLDVYVSGSSVTTEPQFLNIAVGEINPEPNTDATLIGDFADGKVLGNRIGTIRSKPVPGMVARVTMQFRANENGRLDLKFVTRKGSWLVGEVEVLADKQTGFSPNYVRVFKRIPTEHLKTPLTFKFQYFDFRGNKAELESYAYGAIFNGGNLYVQGDNNLITGSTYVSNEIGSGIEMSGQRSGYFRSTKYEGFTSASAGTGPAGWLMWSGSSALQIGADTYEGVGLELIANSESFFRYRSTPSEVIIKTDKFFFGSETTQFISGSDGILEISSSNFHLTPAGDVTASNALFTGTALANAILNKTITITAANSGSYFDEVTADDTSNTPAYNLVLNGSNGGEIVTSVNINCALARPIFKYVIPDYGSGAESTDIRIENNNANTKILNTFISKGSSVPSSYDQIDVTNGAVLVIAVRGTNLSTQNSYPIAGTENISGLSTDGYLVRRNLRVGDGDGNGGSIIVSGSISTNSSFTQDRLQFQVGENISALRLSMGTGKTTTTSATITGAKTAGNWNTTSFIGHDPNVLYRAHLILSGSGANVANRRLLMAAGTHYGTYTSTSTSTFAVRDADNIIVNDHTSGTKNITLPGANDAEEGRMITIIHVNAGAQTNVNGGIYVPGTAIPDTTRTSTTANSTMTVLYSHARGGWIVINQNGTWS